MTEQTQVDAEFAKQEVLKVYPDAWQSDWCKEVWRSRFWNQDDEDHGPIGIDWPDAYANLPTSVVATEAGEVDWTSDEATVQAVFPGAHCRFVASGYQVFLAHGARFSGKLFSSPVDAWAYERRYNPDVQAFERQHNPAYAEAMPLDKGGEAQQDTSTAAIKEVLMTCPVCEKTVYFPADDNPKYIGDDSVTSNCGHMIYKRSPSIAAGHATWMEICGRCGKLRAGHRDSLCYPDTFPGQKEEFIPSGRYPSTAAGSGAVGDDTLSRALKLLQIVRNEPADAQHRDGFNKELNAVVSALQSTPVPVGEEVELPLLDVIPEDKAKTDARLNSQETFVVQDLLDDLHCRERQLKAALSSIREADSKCSKLQAISNGHLLERWRAEDALKVCERERNELRSDLYEVRNVVTAENFIEMQQRAEIAEGSIREAENRGKAEGIRQAARVAENHLIARRNPVIGKSKPNLEAQCNLILADILALLEPNQGKEGQ